MKQYDSEIADCIQTFEQDVIKLCEIEMKLAVKLNLDCYPHEIREKLFELNSKNQLVEDDLVADWHCAITSYLHELNQEYN